MQLTSSRLLLLLAALQICGGEYIRQELANSTNPYEMAAAVKTTMQGPTAVAAAAAATAAATAASSAAPMDDESVHVKREFDDGLSKKRRRTVESVTLPAPSGLRASAAAAAAFSSSSSSAAAASAASSLLPDTSSLEGIQLLMDLFGESLQPFLTSALASFAVRSEETPQQQAQQTRGPNTFRISKNAGRNNTINVATAFV